VHRAVDGSPVTLWVPTATVKNMWLSSRPSKINVSPSNQVVTDERCRIPWAVVQVLMTELHMSSSSAKPYADPRWA
jgi:hypothetical protein